MIRAASNCPRKKKGPHGVKAHIHAGYAHFTTECSLRATSQRAGKRSE